MPDVWVGWATVRPPQPQSQRVDFILALWLGWTGQANTEEKNQWTESIVSILSVFLFRCGLACLTVLPFLLFLPLWFFD
jgi:hypothetical protein